MPLHSHPVISQPWHQAGESELLGAASGANGFTATSRPSTPAFPVPRALREEAVEATLEKVWGSVSGRPGHTGDPEAGDPRFSPPGATQSRLPCAAPLASGGAQRLTSSRQDPGRAVGGIVGTSPRGEGGWVEDARPSHPALEGPGWVARS